MRMGEEGEPSQAREPEEAWIMGLKLDPYVGVVFFNGGRRI